MAIQSRRGNISNFDKSKMLPGEWGIALDSQEAFICFGAGITKKMATYEDYQDMLDDCITVTQTAQGVVDSFNNLEIEKLAIDDASVSYITGWSSEKISKYDTKDNTVSFTEATTRENIVTGEKQGTIFSKIKKFFSDLKTVAFTGKYTDLTNVAIENPTTLPTASTDTLGKIYRDGTGLKITLRSGNEGSYTYSWVPFISKDKVVNSFNVTEDGFVADARGLKVLKDGLDGVNNNLQLIDFTGTTLSYSHASGMSMLELPSIPNKSIIAIYPVNRVGGLTYNGFFTNDWGACLALLTDGSNASINNTEVSIKILAL